MRALSTSELDLVTKLAAANEEVPRLSLDVPRLFVSEETGDRARITFGMHGYERPPYRGQRALPIEGRLKDLDGDEISAILYVDENARLLELELIRWGHGPLQSPRWDTATILNLKSSDG